MPSLEPPPKPRKPRKPPPPDASGSMLVRRKRRPCSRPHAVRHADRRARILRIDAPDVVAVVHEERRIVLEPTGRPVGARDLRRVVQLVVEGRRNRLREAPRLAGLELHDVVLEADRIPPRRVLARRRERHAVPVLDEPRTLAVHDVDAPDVDRVVRLPRALLARVAVVGREGPAAVTPAGEAHAAQDLVRELHDAPRVLEVHDGLVGAVAVAARGTELLRLELLVGPRPDVDDDLLVVGNFLGLRLRRRLRPEEEALARVREARPAARRDDPALGQARVAGAHDEVRLFVGQLRVVEPPFGLLRLEVGDVGEERDALLLVVHRHRTVVALALEQRACHAALEVADVQSVAAHLLGRGGEDERRAVLREAPRRDVLELLLVTARQAPHNDGRAVAAARLGLLLVLLLLALGLLGRRLLRFLGLRLLGGRRLLGSLLLLAFGFILLLLVLLLLGNRLVADDARRLFGQAVGLDPFDLRLLARREVHEDERLAGVVITAPAAAAPAAGAAALGRLGLLGLALLFVPFLLLLLRRVQQVDEVRPVRCEAYGAHALEHVLAVAARLDDVVAGRFVVVRDRDAVEDPGAVLGERRARHGAPLHGGLHVEGPLGRGRGRSFSGRRGRRGILDRCSGRLKGEQKCRNEVHGGES